jgi:hypothetical protein
VYGPVAVHHGRDGGIESELRAQFLRQRLDADVVLEVPAHQNIGQDYLHATFPQPADSGNRSFERPGDQSDRIVYFRPMRIDADLHGIDVRGCQAGRLPLRRP